MKQRLSRLAAFFALILALILLAILVILIWVAMDPTFTVGANELNLIQNPNFDDPERGFAGWNTAGCASYVIPPKPGAAKAGPTSHSGLCEPGDTAAIWQTLPVSGSQVIDFRYQETLKGDNHITVTFDDGSGWEWVARDTTAQNNATFTPLVYTTIPTGTDYLTITIGFEYCPNLVLEECGIGSKVTAVTVTGD